MSVNKNLLIPKAKPQRDLWRDVDWQNLLNSKKNKQEQHTEQELNLQTDFQIARGCLIVQKCDSAKTQQ